MLYNCLLEIQHDCPFSMLSQKHPQVEISLWCNKQHDILELRGEKTSLEKIVADFENKQGKIIKIFADQDNVQIIFKPCKCNESPLFSIFDKYDCLELPPIKYFAGREILNSLMTPDDAGSILEDIRKTDPHAEVRMLKLAPLKKLNNPYPLFLPLDELAQSFTTKQLHALILAFNQGYYELPRKVLVETLAERMNIHRRTYEDHLRKAERKIMNLLIPTLMLYHPRSPDLV